jgi:signal transduction histidine kinase
MVTGDATHFRIEVKNCGAVIERTTLARVFDPLTRGPDHRGKADREGSLGLGLYIASEIAKAHHGAIEARSDETETSKQAHIDGRRRATTPFSLRCVRAGYLCRRR